MTDKQKSFLESLINQYGYNLDSPLRKLFWDRVFQYGETVESASSAIEWLLKENHKRKFPKYLRFDTKEVQTVSDFAQFVFCPASHSIKKTFRYDSDSSQDSIVDDDPIESTFLALLEQIRQNRQLMEHLHAENIKVLSPMLNIFFESTLIYNGYTNEYSKPFTNEDYKISGKPKLIFSHPQKGFFLLLKNM